VLNVDVGSRTDLLVSVSVDNGRSKYVHCCEQIMRLAAKSEVCLCMFTPERIGGYVVEFKTIATFTALAIWVHVSTAAAVARPYLSPDGYRDVAIEFGSLSVHRSRCRWRSGIPRERFDG